MRHSALSYLACSLILLSQLAFESCRKLSNGPDCEPVPEIKGPSTGYKTVNVGKHFGSACFNPDNENEFVFLSNKQGMGADTLFIYDRATRQIRKVLEIDLWYPPKWGINGWILLGIAGGNIGMMKPNGDSLADVSQSSDNYHHPSWNATSTRIFAYSFDNPNVLLTLDGSVTDSFLLGAGEVNFIDDDRIIANGAGAGIYTISRNEYDRICPPHNTNNDAGAGQMINNEEFVWADSEGIYKTNIISRQTTTLKASCNSRRYFSPTVNKSRTKVLWTRVVIETSGQTLYNDYEIVEMNTDGTGEREIPIPE